MKFETLEQLRVAGYDQLSRNTQVSQRCLHINNAAKSASLATVSVVSWEIWRICRPTLFNSGLKRHRHFTENLYPRIWALGYRQCPRDHVCILCEKSPIVYSAAGMQMKRSLFARFWSTQSILCLHLVQLLGLLVLVQFLVRLNKNKHSSYTTPICDNSVFIHSSQL